MERILVIYYSQTGQLKSIAEQFAKPFREEGVEVDTYTIEMEENFPFPWTDETFFGVFPESFLQIPQEVKPVPQSIMERDYSLIVLAYQVWYLSPSIPINSFLKSEQAKKLLAGKPVFTLSGTRNMWITSGEKIRQLLLDSGATLVGNVALTDRHHNHISVITIVHWLFSGKKDRYLGIFPTAGVSEEDILGVSKFGRLTLEHLKGDIYDKGLQKEVIAQGGVLIKPFLLFAERTANRIFRLWAKKIYNNPRRNFLLKCFHYYLYVAIWVLMPIVWLFYWLTYPLFYKKIRKDVERAQSVW